MITISKLHPQQKVVARDLNGRFIPGSSGRPKGMKNIDSILKRIHIKVVRVFGLQDGERLRYGNLGRRFQNKR